MKSSRTLKAAHTRLHSLYLSAICASNRYQACRNWQLAYTYFRYAIVSSRCIETQQHAAQAASIERAVIEEEQAP